MWGNPPSLCFGAVWGFLAVQNGGKEIIIYQKWAWSIKIFFFFFLNLGLNIAFTEIYGSLNPDSNNPQSTFFPVHMQNSERKFVPPALSLAGISVPMTAWNGFLLVFLFWITMIRLDGAPCCVLKGECTAVHGYNSRLLNTCDSFLFQRSLGFKVGCLADLQWLLLPGRHEGHAKTLRCQWTRNHN